LKLNITLSHLHGLVFFCQIVTMPVLMRSIISGSAEYSAFQMIVRIIGVVYGVWSLDFFRALKLDICIGTDTLQNMVIDLAIALYPLFLMVLSYFVVSIYDRLLVFTSMPFHAFFNRVRNNWKIKTSLIDAFATFFLLSNLKFLSVSFDLLAPVRIYQLRASGQVVTSWRLYYDANVPYFGQRHLPYAIMAIAVLVLFVILPVMLLILYPFRCFQKLLYLLPTHQNVLHTFMDSFQGCYKDGTEQSTRDCHWFAAAFFLARFFGTLAGALTQTAGFFLIGVIILILLLLLLLILQPYKSDYYSESNAVFILLLAMLFTSITGFMLSNQRSMEVEIFVFYLCITGIITFLPLIYMFVTILRWVCAHV